ncbi:unnamed protein product [Didymodactylos carnosus]|uniref:OTU domain-containing protein n=1 Tax=Didymodactylos carnosus TaxID=1234261 RepID=A0A8S2QEJ5_9BILA|nr:unnamed protein product [Didymodactylos carnosus]CAF4106347.1 unnamed protein product [Didymodactylos carnosus]
MCPKHTSRQQKNDINNNNKRHERDTRRQEKKDRNTKQYLKDDGNADKFRDQLRTIGLELRDVVGDGNCLFRSFADQMDGDAGRHAMYREQVCDYILKNRQDFEPFIVDQPFDTYIKSLAKDGTYAGNESIVAFARLHNAKICVHQLQQPVWVVSFSNNPKYEFHISYHNFEHYSSVRRLGDVTSASANVRLEPTTTAKSVTTSNFTSNSEKNKKEEASNEYSINEHDISYIISQTNTNDKNLIHQTLIDFNNNVDSTIAYLLARTSTNNNDSDYISDTCGENLQRIMSITGMYDPDLIQQSYMVNNSDVDLTIQSLLAMTIDNTEIKNDDNEYIEIPDNTLTPSSSTSLKPNSRQKRTQMKKDKKQRATERRRAEIQQQQQQQSNDKNTKSSSLPVCKSEVEANVVEQPNPIVNIEFIQI